VQNTLENMIELKKEVAATVCAQTKVLDYLMKRIKSDKFDSNTLYVHSIPPL
jgi:hypothetical protein